MVDNAPKLNIRLKTPYTFDACTFDFTDLRAGVPISHFGILDITQELTESLRLQDGVSGKAEIHTAFEESMTLSSPPLDAGTSTHRYAEKIRAGDSASFLPREPIHSEFTERMQIGTFITHEQHGHIYMDFTERFGVSAALLPPLATLCVESISVAKNPLESPRTDAVVCISAKTARRYDLSQVFPDTLGIQVASGQEFSARRSFSEGVSFHESVARQLHIHMFASEGIGIAEKILPPLKGEFTERLEIVAELLPPLASSFVEQISAYDGIMRPSEASVSGVVIGKGMSLEEFKERLVRPVGYDSFRPFHVGEYEYEKALVRISMKAGSLGAIPQIYDVAMNVDIDDTVDRGTAHIEAKESIVQYNKHYYIKPEVAVTLQRGSTADGVLTPVITSIGTGSFKCLLRKADGTAAAGTISWTAVGY